MHPSESSPATGPSHAVTGSVDAACQVLTGFLDRFAACGKSHAMDLLAATDLTFSQLKVLFALGSHADAPCAMPVNEIADHVNLSFAATGRTVDKLVGSGLVDRREDATDRRVKRVSLTAEGRRIVDEQLSFKDELVTAFVSGLPDELRSQLSEALQPIVDSDVDYFALLEDSGASGTTPHDSAPDHSQKVTA